MFLPVLKLYLWSIHLPNNLNLAISFDFKLNLKLAIPQVCVLLSFMGMCSIGKILDLGRI